jgi:hypothetical protein
MTTPKQIEANRRNAKKSSGPKTTRGKGITKLNALKHGLCAEQVVIPGEEPKDFEALRQRLTREIGPEDLIEEQLVDWIALSSWRMKRGAVFEAALFTYLRLQNELEQASAELESIDSEQKYADMSSAKLEVGDAYLESFVRKYEVSVELGRAIAVLGKAFETGETTLMNVVRYQSAAEHSFCRALRELDRRRAKRQERGPTSISDKEEKSDTVITLPAKRL